MGESYRHIKDDIYAVVKWVGLASIAMFAFVLLIIGLNDFGNDWGKSEKQKFAEKYYVSQDKVFIDPRPHGCDFSDAPLGNKHCHYDRKEKAVKDDRGQIIAVYVTWDKVEE